LRYNSAEEILEAWCERRLVFYDKRYDYQLGLYKRELLRAKNKYVFVKAVKDKKLDLYQEDEDVEKDMLAMKLSKMAPEKKNKNVAQIETDDGEDNEDDEVNDKAGKKKDTSIPSFDYLLNMHIGSMTVKRLEKLKKEIDSVKSKIEVLKGKTPKDLWREDLAKFDVGYKKYLKDYPLI
jgi:hypothetical protein